MVKEIVSKENPILRKIATEVSISDIESPKIQTILADMKETLHAQEDGVALAAPQIGVSLRIFVVSPRVETLLPKKKKALDGKIKKNVEHFVYINPVLTKLSHEKHDLEEGCLSARYLYGKIKRSLKATVTAYDEDGKKFTRGGSGILAQIFQHETDHLNGILFLDSAYDVEDIPPENVKAKRELLAEARKKLSNESR